jgi:hypothetical protein
MRGILVLACALGVLPLPANTKIPRSARDDNMNGAIRSGRSTAQFNQIFCFFQRPCLNRIALTTAIALSAMAMEKNAPFERMCIGIASQ